MFLFFVFKNRTQFFLSYKLKSSFCFLMQGRIFNFHELIFFTEMKIGCSGRPARTSGSSAGLSSCPAGTSGSPAELSSSPAGTSGSPAGLSSRLAGTFGWKNNLTNLLKIKSLIYKPVIIVPKFN